MIESDDATKRILVTTLVKLENQLRELAKAADRQAMESPLPALRADMTAQQQRMLEEGAHRLRAAMRNVLRRHGLTAPEPPASALQTCRNVLHQALAIVEELAPRPQDGGTRPSDEFEADLRRTVAQLLDPLDDMQWALAPRDEPSGTGDEDVEALRRIARSHGLSQFDGPLRSLAERTATHDFMIAVFGLTNAGKSSLINRLLETELLPVDATPATAVPVRLCHGPRPRGVAHFARAATEVFQQGRLAEFVSARYNPGNCKHVESLVFETPSPRLAGGVCLLDTPAWSVDTALPPCDLGLVLIDATGSLSLEEAALIDALRRSGSAVIVLLTKADRLGERDRWEVYGHVTARLQTGVDPQVPVFFASSTSSDTTLRDDWIARGLQPFVARRETLKSVSLHHKVQRIRADIIRCLEQLSGRLSAGARNQRIASVQREGINLVADAERRAVDPQAESRIQIDRLLREVAHNAAELSWQGDEAAMQLAAMIEASLTVRADAARRDIVRKLELLAAQCGDLLAKVDGPAFTWQAQAMLLPTLDVGALVPILEVPRPWFAGFGAWVVQWYLLRKLRRRRLPATLETLLRNHLSSLDRWRHAALSDLGKAFAGACEARLDKAAQVALDLAHLRAALRSPTDRGSDDAEEGRDAHTRLHGG